MFGGKLAKEVFNAKISIGSPKVKGHGASHDIRLLELKSITTKNIYMVKFKAHKRFQRCHS